jgi:nucleoside-diphosphate-sugar epimerase
MRLLVLGGTHHVGRCLVEDALARGWDVTTLNRGLTGQDSPGVDARIADRRDPAALAEALGSDEWDFVLDTWSGAPSVARSAARLLTTRAGHFGYVSTRSVYVWPIPTGADESAPVVEGDPGSEEEADYATVKRGCELAVLESFGERALVARPGLILGPYERVGRLPFWLRRLAAGGRVPAPGPQERPLQYIDGRDLAAWMLEALSHGVGGTYNAVSRPGHTTIGALLSEAVAVTGNRADLVWLTPEQVESAGASGWTELPIWVPPTGELAALHDGDTSAAHRVGLRCRPMAETVADTWAWLQREGYPGDVRPDTGFGPERESRLLAEAKQA